MVSICSSFGPPMIPCSEFIATNSDSLLPMKWQWTYGPKTLLLGIQLHRALAFSLNILIKK